MSACGAAAVTGGATTAGAVAVVVAGMVVLFGPTLVVTAVIIGVMGLGLAGATATVRGRTTGGGDGTTLLTWEECGSAAGRDEDGARLCCSSGATLFRTRPNLVRMNPSGGVRCRRALRKGAVERC